MSARRLGLMIAAVATALCAFVPNASAKAGDLLVVDYTAFGGDGAVFRIDPATGAQTTITQGGLFGTATDIAIERDGKLLVVDQDLAGPGPGTGGVIRIDPATGAQSLLASGGLFDDPTGIELDPQGRILIADQQGPGGGDVIRV